MRDAIVQDSDGQGRIVMRYIYDMLGTVIYQASMEAGERWMLGDVAGQPIRAWDNRDHEFRTTYDALRRPVGSYLVKGTEPEILVGRTVYGENQPDAETNNLRGQVVQIFDQAGVVTNSRCDFKGNPLHNQRQLAQEYKKTLDWSAAVPLEADIFNSGSKYDALNRPTQTTAPDNSVIRPTYNEANLLERVDANLRGATIATPFVTNIDYDAKGQRQRIDYGNGTSTTYEYDPLTFRLTHLRTRRGTELLQDLGYTYDPVGNITNIRDDAQQTIFFRNQRVEPSNEYTYDALYRLIEATGREHLGQGGAPIPHSHNDSPRTGLKSGNVPGQFGPNEVSAMGTYIERYVYDAVGNFLQMKHRGSDPTHSGWTRSYAYHEASLIEPGKQGNRMSQTVTGNGNTILETYTHDAHGNMLQMPHLPLMQWDYRDQLQATAKQVISTDGLPETTWYVYDAGGQRVRKVTERQAAAGEAPKRIKERIYLGGFEIFRAYENNGDTVTVERETLHIMDDTQRVALIETRIHGNDYSLPQLVRYQLGNHLGSASLELDEQAQIISYEEYAPYGSTSYQAGRSKTEVKQKRYRYTGKEKDDETGLYYHESRYYAPWTGRWISPDPAGIVDGMNLYMFVRNNSIMHTDSTGKCCDQPIETSSFVDPTELTYTALHPAMPVEQALLDEEELDDLRIDVENYEEYEVERTIYVSKTDVVNQDTYIQYGATAILGGITLDTTIPDPTDLAWPKWAGYAVAGGISLAILSNTSTTTITRDVPVTIKETRKRKVPLVYINYTKLHVPTGQIYSGRARGYGTAQEILTARDKKHHMTAKGYAPATLDEFSTATRPISQRHLDPAYQANRGREQQMIDLHGGSTREGGTSGNTIRGVSKINPLGKLFHDQASLFFGEVSPYTGIGASSYIEMKLNLLKWKF